MTSTRIIQLVAILWLGFAAATAALGQPAGGSPSDRQEPMSDLDRVKASSQLHYELLLKHYDRALELMVQTEDIDFIEPVTGRAALATACADPTADAIDVVRPLVLQYGADVNLQDRIGLTPLYHAASAGNMAVVRLLLDNGADVNATNEIGVTPLFAALARKRTRVATLLRQRGADELSQELANGVAMSVALEDAMKGLRRARPSRGTDPVEYFRDRIVASVDTAAATLVAEGKVEQARTLEVFRDQMVEVVENTPREDGMSALDWAKVVASRAGSAFAAAQSGGN